MYEFHRLGWHAFQQLCLTISREILGQTVESFLDTNDGGRDGAFAGTWTRAEHESLSGRFVIQCKFTGKPNHALRPSDLQDELPKVRRLVSEGRCDCYLLLTNAGVSGRSADKTKALLKAAGVKHVVLHGSTWLSSQIRENKRLRMLVPRVYGLGDLSQILDERAYSQARALLSSLQEDFSKIVVTDAYRRAAAALDAHGFVLLVGEPAAGKTTIASLLAMAALDQWNASTLKLDDPAKVIDHWNPDEPSQFFWIDDAFGVTQYESSLVHAWNHRFAQIRTMLRKGAKIVMTSRDYIYNRARRDIKGSAFPLLQESQVVIDVHELTPHERRQILYNHLKLGGQPRSFLAKIKPHLESVAAHPRFIPETARRLSDSLFTRKLALTPYALNQFVEEQEGFLCEVLQGLDNDSKAALALVYMRNGSLQSPIDLEASEEEALQRLGSTLGGCITALEAIDGSLVRHHAGSESVWRFKHPTIGDAFAAILIRSPDLLGIYVQGSAPEKLITQVTCGDVGIERAIVLPKTLFPLVLNRLEDLAATGAYKSRSLSAWEAKKQLHYFLTWRCSKEFLALFLEKQPALLEQVAHPGLMLSAVSEVRLAARLHELGLLPDARRAEFVEAVTRYALEGEDLYAFESDAIRGMFTGAEFEDLRSRVRHELIPRLDRVRHDWQFSWFSDGSPAGYMQLLLESFEALKKEFADDPDAICAIDREIRLANEWIAENEEEDGSDRPRRAIGDVEKSGDHDLHGRSIFDDIDE